MGYLLLSIAAGTIKGYCGKIVSGVADTVPKCIRVSIIRMLLCCFIGLGMIVFGHTPMTLPTMTEWMIYLLSGISMAVFLITWTLAVRHTVFILINACTSSAFIVPMIAGFVLFGESVSLKQILGIAFVVGAVALLVSYNNTVQVKIGIRQAALLAVVMLSQGLNSVSKKMFTFYIPSGSNSVFNFYTFAITLEVLCLWLWADSLRHKPDSYSPELWKKSGYIIVMAVMLFLNSYFLTAATEHVSSVILYALESALSLAASALIATVFFRERLNLTGLAGLACTLVALLLTNG